MAIMIPSNIHETATIGEKKVFKILEDLLPDDYCVWYDVRVNGRYPDFIIFGPDLGVIVLEVKDWQLSFILNADIERFYLSTSGAHKNPLKQARDYMNNLVNELKLDKNLIETEGPYKGNLAFTYGHGVIFTNISKESFKTRFNELISDNFIVYGDELERIDTSMDKKALRDKLSKMFLSRFPFKPLNNIAFRSIKSCIGSTISAPELKIIELETKINNTEDQSKAPKEIEVKQTSSKSKPFALVLLLICILSIGMLFVKNSQEAPLGSTTSKVLSKEDVGRDIIVKGTIEDVIVHKNGHLIITLEGYKDNMEVFINTKVKESFPKFTIGEYYEFSGTLKEYNNKLQLHPRDQ